MVNQWRKFEHFWLVARNSRTPSRNGARVTANQKRRYIKSILFLSCIFVVIFNEKTFLNFSWSFVVSLRSTSVCSRLFPLYNSCYAPMNIFHMWCAQYKSNIIIIIPCMLFQLKGSNHIVCSSVSDNGEWTAFSDVGHLSLFRLSLVCRLLRLCYVSAAFFFTYVDVHVCSIRVNERVYVFLSTPYVYVGRKNAALEINLYNDERASEISWSTLEIYFIFPHNRIFYSLYNQHYHYYRYFFLLVLGKLGFIDACSEGERSTNSVLQKKFSFNLKQTNKSVYHIFGLGQIIARKHTACPKDDIHLGQYEANHSNKREIITSMLSSCLWNLEAKTFPYIPHILLISTVKYTQPLYVYILDYQSHSTAYQCGDSLISNRYYRHGAKRSR